MERIEKLFPRYDQSGKELILKARQGYEFAEEELAKKYDSTETKSDVDDELAALKAELGM